MNREKTPEEIAERAGLRRMEFSLILKDSSTELEDFYNNNPNLIPYLTKLAPLLEVYFAKKQEEFNKLDNDEARANFLKRNQLFNLRLEHMSLQSTDLLVIHLGNRKQARNEMSGLITAPTQSDAIGR